jgi:hypothetical protein
MESGPSRDAPVGALRPSATFCFVSTARFASQGAAGPAPRGRSFDGTVLTCTVVPRPWSRVSTLGGRERSNFRSFHAA